MDKGESPEAVVVAEKTAEEMCDKLEAIIEKRRREFESHRSSLQPIAFYDGEDLKRLYLESRLHEARGVNTCGTDGVDFFETRK